MQSLPAPCRSTEISGLVRYLRSLIAPCAVIAVAAVAAAPGYGSLSAPTLSAPGNGATTDSLPVFMWGAVSGAVKYEFQLAGTSAFSPTLVDFTTGNRRASLTTVLPN